MGIRSGLAGCSRPSKAATSDREFGGTELVSGNSRHPCWKTMSDTSAETIGLRDVSLGKEIVDRVNELAAISETPAHLARIFLTSEHRAAAELILGWMRAAGMSARLDAIGNV